MNTDSWNMLPPSDDPTEEDGAMTEYVMPDDAEIIDPFGDNRTNATIEMLRQQLAASLERERVQAQQIAMYREALEQARDIFTGLTMTLTAEIMQRALAQGGEGARP